MKRLTKALTETPVRISSCFLKSPNDLVRFSIKLFKIFKNIFSVNFILFYST